MAAPPWGGSGEMVLSCHQPFGGVWAMGWRAHLAHNSGDIGAYVQEQNTDNNPKKLGSCQSAYEPGPEGRLE